MSVASIFKAMAANLRAHMQKQSDAELYRFCEYPLAKEWGAAYRTFAQAELKRRLG